MRTAFAIAAMIAITAGTAEARTTYTTQPMRQAGVLTCAVDGSVGYVVGSRRRVMCTFESFGRRGIRETYAGAMERVGFDVGVAGGQVISWTVWTPGGRARSSARNAASSDSVPVFSFNSAGVPMAMILP